ncbi:hypothetical protein LPJ66_000947 [Kickxella alabastrina]|uniref:Uncharacterized protein n=1 Tax=Kickxella alabastrina TaxID=61397 RepID=A0ACC1IUN0_9FUNG|nr:hypothetical protein LPJ66_000947 [Kickxella alabastrina]
MQYLKGQQQRQDPSQSSQQQQQLQESTEAFFFGSGSGSGSDHDNPRTLQPPPYAVATPQQPAQQASGLVSISPDEYYHPASFPGYTVIQLANGEESQALLPRVTQGRQRNQHGRLLVRRVRQRPGCCLRCCGWLFSCICFIVGIFIVLVFLGAVLFVSRHAFPPMREWQCETGSLEVHTDQHYSFPVTAPLRIESVEGISYSAVHIVRGEEGSNVTVRAVVETNRGDARDRIFVFKDKDLLAVRAEQPKWEWPRDCIRTTLHISIPASGPLFPSLNIATGPGTLRALDAGVLSLCDLFVLMRDGTVQLRNLSTQGIVNISSTNGRINATRVAITGPATFTSSNAALALDGIQAASISASTTNSVLRATDLRTDGHITLNTTNAIVALSAVSAGHSISVRSSNGAIRGSISSAGGPVSVITSNGSVDVRIDGSAVKDVVVQSINSSVSVVAVGLHGWFDARTSNGRVNVEGSAGLIRMKRNAIARKNGYFGDMAAGNITVASTNALVSLKFEG